MFGITPLIEYLLENEDQYIILKSVGLSQLHKHYFHQCEASNQFEQKKTRIDENRFKVIQILADNGADIKKEHLMLRMPLSLARKIRDNELFKMLLNKEIVTVMEDTV